MRFKAAKQDVAVKEDGEWLVNFDLYAERA